MGYHLHTVIPVQQCVPDALAEILRRVPLSDEKIAFAWRAAVGQAMDRGTIVSFERGVLRVRARSGAWGREVARSEKLIRGRIDVLLGRGVVSTIEVVQDA